MNYTHQPLIAYALEEIAAVLTQGFAGYFVPITVSAEGLLQVIRELSIDLRASYMICADTTPVGVALIGRRGWTSRLAAMSILPDHRGKGAGTYLMAQLIADSQVRGDREIVLEVIEQNEPALKLYQNAGFTIVRRLTGYTQTPPLSVADVQIYPLQEIDLSELARIVHHYESADLPWQISGATLVNFSLPKRAFRLGSAFLALSDPAEEKIAILSLFVLPTMRGREHAKHIVASAMHQFPERHWTVPALCPEEYGGIFERLAFTRGEISQFQMVRIM